MPRIAKVLLAIVVAGAIVLVATPVEVEGSAPTGASIGMLLVVPVVVVALRAGRRAAYVAAAGAVILLSLLLPPVGTFTIRFGDDVVALAVFAAVALLVSSLVRSRVELLERLEHQREQLLRAVSHDLRTPLAGVRAAASELNADVEHSEAERAELLAVIDVEAERLDRLIANLLTFGRSQAATLTPTRSPVDVGDVIDVAVERATRLSDQVTIAAYVPATLPEIQADDSQLDQLVSNLVENAVRHSPPGGRVVVSAGATLQELAIVVEDDGPGVPVAERQAIFDPYRSGANAGASGLGLAICDAIARAHGGRIDVSESRSGGAAFTVTLPVQPGTTRR